MSNVTCNHTNSRQWTASSRGGGESEIWSELETCGFPTTRASSQLIEPTGIRERLLKEALLHTLGVLVWPPPSSLLKAGPSFGDGRREPTLAPKEEERLCGKAGDSQVHLV